MCNFFSSKISFRSFYFYFYCFSFFSFFVPPLSSETQKRLSMWPPAFFSRKYFLGTWVFFFFLTFLTLTLCTTCLHRIEKRNFSEAAGPPEKSWSIPLVCKHMLRPSQVLLVRGERILGAAVWPFSHPWKSLFMGHFVSPKFQKQNVTILGFFPFQVAKILRLLRVVHYTGHRASRRHCITWNVSVLSQGRVGYIAIANV